jgi:hypothetical protein
VEISVPNAKFCNFNPSPCIFKTTNEEGKNSKESTMPTTFYVTVEHEIHADNEQCSLVWVISEKDLLIKMGRKCFGTS